MKNKIQNFTDTTRVWPNGTHVRFLKEGHRRSGDFGKVVAALPNPSGQPSSQWYDIRFDDGGSDAGWRGRTAPTGRFLVKYLEAISKATVEEKLASAA